MSMPPRKTIARYIPKTSRLKLLMERCQNPPNSNGPSDSQSNINKDKVLPSNNTLNPVVPQEKDRLDYKLNKNSCEEMVNEIYQKNYTFTSNYFQNFNEYTTTQSDPTELSHAVDILQQEFPDTSEKKTDNLMCDVEFNFNEHITTQSEPTEFSHAVDILQQEFPDTNVKEIDMFLNSEEFNINEQLSTESELTELSNAVDLLQAFPDTNAKKTDNLMCDEECMSSSSLQSINNEDFGGSDDSVLDKDYVPESDSVESEEGIISNKTRNKSRNVKSNNANLFKSTNIINRRNTVEVDTTDINKQNKALIKKRRHTINLNLSTIIDNNCIGENTNLPEPIAEELNSHTLNAPKRKKYNTSLAERKLEKKHRKQMQYQVKSGCDSKCRKNCTSLFTHEERKKVNENYWNKTWNERRLFIKCNTPVAVPKRINHDQLVRAAKRTFYLNKTDDTQIEVCKIFFLTTLGFNKSNDKVLYNSIKDENPIDSRGKHIKTFTFDRNIITQHVESFHPLAPHYRREHAPLRRYLPSDLNITLMHKDFLEQHPQFQVSYELYRTHVKDMRISFTKLGNEECEECESYTFHKKETSHDILSNISEDCETCEKFALHYKKYTAARKMYEDHKSKQDQDNLYFSADLQKVIMLPRMDSFKRIIFCLRLSAYNQTFAPLGKITTSHKPLAVLWHDATAGRKQEDIMSAFFMFLLQHRDIKNVHIWLDNCSAQNKNWLLYFMLIHLVNSDSIGTETITLYYFEPGHTFMSADQFHHQVELSMKRKGKIYDFADFSEAVGAANKGRVTVKSMGVEDFINVPNCISDRRIQNSTPRVYLQSISQVGFKRGCLDLLYKTDFDTEYQQLRFLTDKYLRNPKAVTLPKRVNSKGIDRERKMGILNKCSELMPSHKLKFWRDLPESS